MPQVKDKNFGHNGAGQAGITNVETVAVVSNPIIMPNPTAHILIHGSVNINIGAAPTAAILKLYRGKDLTGVLILTTSSYLPTASQSFYIPFDFQEDLANAAGAQYTLSVTMAINQAANNINIADITVEVL